MTVLEMQMKVASHFCNFAKRADKERQLDAFANVDESVWRAEKEKNFMTFETAAGGKSFQAAGRPKFAQTT